MTMLRYIVILILSIHLRHINIVSSQDGKVSEPPTAVQTTQSPTREPTLSPTDEYPKTISFTLKVYMEYSTFTSGLTRLFRIALCKVFGFPVSQCLKDDIDIQSPAPTKAPTTDPTFSPTTDPTLEPTFDPTLEPTPPTNSPTQAPTAPPTPAPTDIPTNAPTGAPTYPTTSPSAAPSDAPTDVPSSAPSLVPSNVPSNAPSNAPSTVPSPAPSIIPSQPPSIAPSNTPVQPPSNAPSQFPSVAPSVAPSNPTSQPSQDPTMEPTFIPSEDPTMEPTYIPSGSPTVEPTVNPTNDPTSEPTMEPSDNVRRLLYNNRKLLQQPSRQPSTSPSISPTPAPSMSPTEYTIYDLELTFYVEVNSYDESETVFDTIKSPWFFPRYKQYLIDTINSSCYEFTAGYCGAQKNCSCTVETVAEYTIQVESMRIDPFGNEVEIESPTQKPTTYPTENYQGGEDFGIASIVFGSLLLAAFVAYWAYKTYIINQEKKDIKKRVVFQDVQEKDPEFFVD